MKNFWKKHRTGIAIGAVLAAVLVLIVYIILILCGFHFTYSPDQHNNWNAVSSVAAWAGVIVSMASVAASIVAIFYAIRVPKEIADRQDKIALFEKRSELYAEIRKYYALANCLSNGDNDYIIKKTIHHLLGLTEFSYDEIAAFSYKTSLRLMQIPFLFPGVDEKDVTMLSGIIVDFLSCYMIDADKNDTYKESYEEHMLEFFEKYEALFRGYMKIDTLK